MNRPGTRNIKPKYTDEGGGMKVQAKQSGPTREQLTDEQWSRVCRLFDTLDRIARKYAPITRLGRV